MKNQPILWIDNLSDIGSEADCTVIGKVELNVLKREFHGLRHYQPKSPLAPDNERQLPAECPSSLKELYNIAARDLHQHGIDPNKLYVHLLYHSDWIEPDGFLRGSYWHFDFTRMLGLSVQSDRMPVALEYSVSTGPQTLFATQLNSPDSKLPARDTISNGNKHELLGEAAKNAGSIWQPSEGQIVRYNSLTLHTGQRNSDTQRIPRVFVHVAFSPVG
jgi:hypothetical protein